MPFQKEQEAAWQRRQLVAVSIIFCSSHLQLLILFHCLFLQQQTWLVSASKLPASRRRLPAALEKLLSHLSHWLGTNRIAQLEGTILRPSSPKVKRNLLKQQNTDNLHISTAAWDKTAMFSHSFPSPSFCWFVHRTRKITLYNSELSKTMLIY